MTRISSAEPQITTWLEVHHCGECGVVFAFTWEFYKQRKADRQTWYCPNGHPRVFTGPTEAEKARERAKTAELRLKWAEERERAWRDQAEAAERQRRAQKAANTKLRKRIANGVCPCCKRTFKDLARHMGNKHPDYGQQDPPPATEVEAAEAALDSVLADTLPADG